MPVFPDDNLADCRPLAYAIPKFPSPSYKVHNLNRFTLLTLIALMAGCASTADKTSTAVTANQPVTQTPARPASPAISYTRSPPASPAPAALTDAQVNTRVMTLLPAKLSDKKGWAGDMQSAFKSLHIAPLAENYCAVIAVVEQESGFQADPYVPGLPAIVRREIEQRRDKYHIPQTVVDWILSTTSSDGRSYQRRIDALRTEKELSDMIEEIVASIPVGKELFANYNPIRTGGPMQVSVEFAEGHARVRPYPYPVHGNLRNEVFSRRGGLYFGAAILLDYPAPYDDILYRFADFNAGRYSSRNAAFQLALSRVSRQPLALDGDLLRYEKGHPVTTPSNTKNALTTISQLLNMSDAEIDRDLLLEKLSTFSQTPLYSRLYALADRKGIQPRMTMPGINLNSPKFQRKLTTAWFANRVNTRFYDCLKRGAKFNSSFH